LAVESFAGVANPFSSLFPALLVGRGAGGRFRVGGRLQFADIANGKPIPEAVIRNIDLWTD
jgi:hypothetical protein